MQALQGGSKYLMILFWLLICSDLLCSEYFSFAVIMSEINPTDHKREWETAFFLMEVFVRLFVDWLSPREKASDRELMRPNLQTKLVFSLLFNEIGVPLAWLLPPPAPGCLVRMQGLGSWIREQWNEESSFPHHFWILGWKFSCSIWQHYCGSLPSFFELIFFSGIKP